MKKIFEVISIVSGIFLFGSIILASIISAFNEHWILGIFLTMVWLPLISFFIYEQIPETKKD